ncbi:hypothetical protein SAMN05421780_105136 [Flexibacter flexilis DSM 6793]|uniref:Uncharacterized protein n=2 Tax=Flexibacter flexilis TaxID=998 RepID=A0A1I1J744_9BACT|nr:hypothetical protein SAMN05421780_105136 [Flexibacter flexilis DSM 6793]
MRVGEITSRKDMEALNLDKKFGLSEKVYNEFLNSLTFENGVFVGAIYDGVERELLDTKSSDAFWAYFGISLRSPQPSKKCYNIR